MSDLQGIWQSEEKVKEYTNSQIEYLIDEHINGRNAQRNRAVLKRRWIDGIPFEPLAEEFDLSVSQVKRIVYKGEKIIFRLL